MAEVRIQKELLHETWQQTTVFTFHGQKKTPHKFDSGTQLLTHTPQRLRHKSQCDQNCWAQKKTLLGVCKAAITKQSWSTVMETFCVSTLSSRCYAETHQTQEAEGQLHLMSMLTRESCALGFEDSVFCTQNILLLLFKYTLCLLGFSCHLPNM